MENYAYQPDDNNGRPFAITRYSPRNSQNNYFVAVKSRSKFFKNTSHYKVLSIMLIVVAVFLLIGLITLIVLYLKSDHIEICNSNECLKTASNLKNSMDFSVDPCENFYKFVCGKWSEEHPNHGWWRTFSSFTTISERVAIASQNALTNKSNESSTYPKAVTKAKDFFKSCIDTESLNVLGLTSIYKYLNRSKLPIVPHYFTIPEDKTESFQFNWMKTETLIKQIFMMDVFVGAVVDINIFNGTENVLYVGKIYQKSPLPSPLTAKRSLRQKNNVFAAKFGSTVGKQDSDDLQAQERLVNSNIMKYVFNEIISNVSTEVPTQEKLQEAVNIIFDMDDVVDEIISNSTNVELTGDDLYTITFKALQSKIDKALLNPQPTFLSKYFNYLFTGTNVTVDPNVDLLYVTDDDVTFLEKIIPYIFESPALHVELYMWWQVVYAMIINTSVTVTDYIQKQLDLFEHNEKYVSRSRSLECSLLVNNYMGYAVSYVLADRSFPNTTKPKVERMVSDLKQAFIDHVKNINWMDHVTKQITIEKSQEMISFIGYPDWLFEEGKMDDYYFDVEINETRYLDNMISIIISQNLKKMNSFREKHQRDWYTEPIEVNAFNSYSENAINIPMVILSFPMYHLGLEVLNYGSIGSILGHELTHGFDDMGRKHDKFGNHVQWWSNATIETFENLTKCFVTQYENITIDGVDDHVRGKATLGENLADNGGLSQAFRAYKNHLKAFGDEPKLPGFENFTNHQLFFIAFGSIWCQTISPEDIKDQLSYDEHCPNSVRVLGTLQNSEDFADAFHCPIGSQMNPMKKCKLW